MRETLARSVGAHPPRPVTASASPESAGALRNPSMQMSSRFYGQSSADGATCAPEGGGVHSLSFDPPADLADVSGWIYTGSFTR